MLGRILAISSVMATVTLVVLLHTTEPAKAGPLGILVVFILMYMSVLGAVTFLFYSSTRIAARATSSIVAKRPVRPMSTRKSYYYSSVVSLAPVMIVGMQSVSDVGITDVLLVALFVAIACVYITKRTG